MSTRRWTETALGLILVACVVLMLLTYLGVLSFDNILVQHPTDFSVNADKIINEFEENSSIESLHIKINKYRDTNGYDRLRLDPTLNKIASQHGENFASQNSLPSKQSIQNMISDSDFDCAPSKSGQVGWSALRGFIEPDGVVSEPELTEKIMESIKENPPRKQVLSREWWESVGISFNSVKNGGRVRIYYIVIFCGKTPFSIETSTSKAATPKAATPKKILKEFDDKRAVDAFHKGINDYRDSINSDQLSLEDNLNEIASRHSADLASQDSVNPEPHLPDMFRESDCAPTQTGRDLWDGLWGYNGTTTVVDESGLADYLVKSIKERPTLKRKISDDRWERVGIGFKTTEFRGAVRIYWTVVLCRSG